MGVSRLGGEMEIAVKGDGANKEKACYQKEA